MNIPDNIYATAREMEADGSRPPSAVFEYVAEWARKEALKEAAEKYSTRGMTATTQYVKDWLTALAEDDN